eukprot:gnl/MRDRNA2_/MRDRNA2_23633_c0_seq1.p2 gnl/MRDRNA2_/MRDRNA2_23633_c0~~gnl/MRDRNA2_/MRDRNA2_23633_c0_seq1.p2  ORF type:complete len:111 (+),score=5.83 gnl/MRDRNA2_/MRDRNA2_23633_c0_seq1:50-382(+)
MKSKSTSMTTSTSTRCQRRHRLRRRIVTGKVQGVYYRESTKRRGDSLGISGAAWNLSDGRVEIVAEGDKDKLETLIEWCWTGPEGAGRVLKVQRRLGSTTRRAQRDTLQM